MGVTSVGWICRSEGLTTLRWVEGCIIYVTPVVFPSSQHQIWSLHRVVTSSQFLLTCGNPCPFLPLFHASPASLRLGSRCPHSGTTEWTVPSGMLLGHLQVEGKDSLGVPNGQSSDGAQKPEITLLLRTHWPERVMWPHPHSETGNSIFSCPSGEQN